jgi:hypothetical protein
MVCNAGIIHYPTFEQFGWEPLYALLKHGSPSILRSMNILGGFFTFGRRSTGLTALREYETGYTVSSVHGTFIANCSQIGLGSKDVGLVVVAAFPDGPCLFQANLTASAHIS